MIQVGPIDAKLQIKNLDVKNFEFIEKIASVAASTFEQL